MIHQLKLYKASAGSGKTFSLTREYMALLLQKPGNYKRILAVTFTNKAAEEMKNRIIRELHTLSQDGAASEHMAYLSEKLQGNQAQVSKAAQDALFRILHDYGRFSIFTIDTFFQRILQSVSREIGIQGGYRLELEQDEIIQEAIDRLIRSIEEDPQIKTWLTDFVYDKMKAGKSWQIRKDLSSLSQELFKESFSKHENKLFNTLKDHQSIIDFKKALLQHKKSFENTTAAFQQKATVLLRQHDLNADDLKGKTKGPINLFNKFTAGEFEVTSTREKARTEESEWHTKTSPKTQAIQACLQGGLLHLYNEAIDFVATNHRFYATLNGVLKQIYTLGLLHTIHQHVYTITREQNIFLLQDTGKLLNDLIGDNDAPFIYEKIGNTYDYLMIDEFQDTSMIQWENFTPLFLDNMGKGFCNLIVGDIKQSIYRWRNSDWSILANQIEKTFANFSIQQNVLQNNWRSMGNIIAFNNTFFSFAKERLQEMIDQVITNSTGQATLDTPDGGKDDGLIDKAYEDYFQQLGKKGNANKGYVHISFLEKDAYPEKTYEALTQHIENLQKSGVPASGIAILTRKKKEGENIATHLYQHKESDKALPGISYDVVSSEVLRIDKSIPVKILLSTFETLINREDRLAKITLLHYLKVNDPSLPYDKDKLFVMDTPTAHQQIVNILGRLAIKDSSIYELAEKVYAKLSLHKHKQHIPYLDKFMETIYTYGQHHSNDLFAFLQWWKEKGVDEALAVSEHQDAIRILTIHKSKGLEFDAVIIPYADWSFDYHIYNQPILWCEPEPAPFNKLPVVPLYYSDAKKSIFLDRYLEEKSNYIVDTLNVFYVGVTRAKNNLILLSQQPEEDTKGAEPKRLNTLLHQACSSVRHETSTSGYINPSQYWDAAKQSFVVGTIVPSEMTKETSPVNLLQSYESNSSDRKSNLCIKKHGEDFFDETKESAGMTGTILHAIFNKVKKEGDFEKEIHGALHEGLIKIAQVVSLLEAVKQAFTSCPEAARWFSDEGTVLNEREILTPEGERYRPDRVVVLDQETAIIDYKFGKLKHGSHQEQVKAYATLLNKMGYKEVKAYLWYVNLNAFERVPHDNSHESQPITNNQ